MNRYKVTADPLKAPLYFQGDSEDEAWEKAKKLAAHTKLYNGKVEKVPTEAEKDDRIAALKAFVTAFLDNFKPCDKCEGGLFMGDTCPKCYGTAEIVESVGILYVDLPERARELLEAK